MAKPTKHAGLICLILTVLAVAGGVCGYLLKLPVVLVLTLLPAAVYEIFRTEGPSTRASSALIGVGLLAQAVVMLGGFQVDVLSLFRSLSVTVELPAALLSLQGVLAVVVAILAVALFAKTRGIYTRWLAVLVFLGSAGLLYLLAPAEIAGLLR